MGHHTGTANLPLHGGKAPAWLFGRMVKLSREIVSHVVQEYGPEEMLRRLSDPFWFQAMGCVLGFDWHSSGVTTTTCGAIKEGIRGLESELGFYAAGGKGGTSRKTPSEITSFCETTGDNPLPLVTASKLSAKVDSACVQDGYQLYHHAFFFTGQGSWCVVQQGMNDQNRMARRYHWLSEKVESYVDEPHAAVCCDHRGSSLNLVAHEADRTRAISTELASMEPEQLRKELDQLPTLTMPARHPVTLSDINTKYLNKILLKTYTEQPKKYEELLGIPGVGARTLRSLALIGELIHGAPVCTRDPARFSFAHGGKDGTPFPVDRKTYDTTISIMHRALGRAHVDYTEKNKAVKRLTLFARSWDRH